MFLHFIFGYLLVVPGPFVVLTIINPIVPPIAGLSLVPKAFSQPKEPAPHDHETPAMALSQPVERSSRSARQAKAAAAMEQLRQARGYLPPSKRGRR